MVLISWLSSGHSFWNLEGKMIMYAVFCGTTCSVQVVSSFAVTLFRFLSIYVLISLDML